MRHGRTAWNVDGRFQGQTDIPLDAEGRAQARALAAALAHERFDVAVASDLVRAQETGDIILAGRRPPVAFEVDARLREMRFGTWEGLTWEEIVARDPALADASSTQPKRYTPPGGESFDDLCVRVGEALAALDARVADGANVLLVTHAGSLHALLRVALGAPEADALGVRFSPAGVTRLALGPGGNRIVTLNVTEPAGAAS